MRGAARVILILLAATLGPACSCGKTVPKVVAHPKDLGEGCTADSDCASNLCAVAPGASTKTCQQPCTNGCPSGERCVSLGTSSSGSTEYACEHDPAKLCSTCVSDADCGYPGDSCLGDPSGTASCGQDCSGDGKCPQGYTCEAATHQGGGNAGKQCVPQSGTCACTESSRGQTRPCEHTNNYGTCNGVEICDPAQGWGNCDALVPALEVCDGVDNDCNGKVDDGLGTSTCGQGDCQVTVDNCKDGHPQTCQPDMTKATTEVCNGKDDDCDGIVDNGFDLSTDVNNCGACGRACPSQNGTPTCSNGFCSLTCSQGYDDCNHSINDGCEANIGSDVNNCGVCGNRCDFAVGVPACDAGNCLLAACQNGYYDIDGNPANGCEYACVYLSDSDLPDITNFPDGGLGFTDSNCDGLDGEIDGSVFVASNGNDSNPGTMAQPFRTIQKGIDTAFSQGLPNVYVASGSYTGQVNLHDGVGIFGGYVQQPGVWGRSLTVSTTLSGANPVLVGTDVHDVTVQLFTIQGSPATSASQSSIAVQFTDSVNVVMDNVQVQGNYGAAGNDGANGNNGASGSAGADGAPGYEDSSWPCSSGNGRPQPGGGAAGTNLSCTDANGGKGGSAAHDSNTGANGSPSAAGAAGGPGRPTGQGDSVPPGQYDGQNGWTVNPTDGAAGSWSLSSFSATNYTPADGSDGANGPDGIGGGGGGGGGGGTSDCDSWGSGAGGGGAGGCGGTKGTHGAGGGASIAIWLSNTNLELLSCDVTAGNGGVGGKGGKGGNGGNGAVGGKGTYSSNNAAGQPYPPGSNDGEQDDGSVGGNGGVGSNGSRGGHAGGGGGGPSFGVLRLNGASVDNQGSSVVPGVGGAGGASNAGVTALKGADGLSQAMYP